MKSGEYSSMVGRVVGSIVLAFAAFVVSTFILMPATGGAGWRSESVVAFLSSAIWMLVGLSVARSAAVPAGIPLFLSGAAVAAYLSIGLVHSVSPYFGLFPFECACVGGMLVWLLHHRKRSTLARTAAFITPIMVLVAVWSRALLFPPLTFPKRVVLADSTELRLPAIPANVPGENGYYLWTRKQVATPVAPGSHIWIEWDPGSGDGGPFRITPVDDAVRVRAACEHFRVSAKNSLDDDIGTGSVPPFMRAIAIRYPDCEKGQLWRASVDSTYRRS